MILIDYQDRRPLYERDLFTRSRAEAILSHRT